MNEIVNINFKLESLIYEIRGVQVMLDSDIANLYNVETKRINEAVKNNPLKFPERFCFVLNEFDERNLRSKFSTSSLKHEYGGRRHKIRVFTEQGIYMLATILKSDVATKVTIEIMDTFVQMRHYVNFNRDLLPKRVLLLEEKVDTNTERINKLFDMFDSKSIAKEYLFYENELFKSHYVLMKIFDLAKEEIVIIDNYAGIELLNELKEINKKIIIVSKNINDILIKKYESEYKNVVFIKKDIFHDRFIIIDKKILFTCGSSFKDLGKKCFAINQMENKYILKSILDKIF